MLATRTPLRTGVRAQCSSLRSARPTLSSSASSFIASPANLSSAPAPMPLRSTVTRALNEEIQERVAEDAASFALEEQKPQSWALFVGLLTGVLALLYAVWISPATGAADDYVSFLKGLSDDPSVVMLLILTVFAIFHSGLAALRPAGEKVIGPRAYRVIFALVSLPLAVVALVYFINHRYSGVPLWDLRGLPFVHETVWTLSFISFFFLYPSTFNLLEIAAVDEPKVHLYETGIIRITRHPQAVGQLIWCLAHLMWIGNSFMVATSAGLMAHHLFGCWHGDQRLYNKHGDAFLKVKERTSIVPFAAILEGRQKLPEDYWKEFARAPYIAVTGFTIGCYVFHPIMQGASYWLGW